MLVRTAIAAIALFTAAASANAQDCMQYPPGHFRFECASRIHPGLLARRERCDEEGQQMELRHGGGHEGVAGGLRGYVRGCMRREGKIEGHRGGGGTCSGATTRCKQLYPGGTAVCDSAGEKCMQTGVFIGPRGKHFPGMKKQ